MDWINVAQDRDRWRALVSTVMNLRVSKNAGNFLSSLGRDSFSGSSVELVSIVIVISGFKSTVTVTNVAGFFRDIIMILGFVLTGGIYQISHLLMNFNYVRDA